MTGADNAAVTYTLAASGATALLGVDSGLIDSVSGNHVFLFLEGGQVVGREGTSAAAAATVGPIDFTIAVAANGDVTLTQLRAVHELTPDTPTDLSEGIHLDSVGNLVTLKATITDNDGDTATATLDLGKQVTFHDDGPSIALSGQASSLNTDESYIAAATNGGIAGSTPDAVLTQGHALDKENFAGAFTSVTGADNAAVTYTLAASGATALLGVDSGLIDSVSGNHVFLFLEGGQVVGREGTSAAAAATVGPIDFTIAVAANGDVTLTQLRAVHELTPEATPPGDSIEPIHLDNSANLVTLVATITDNDGDTATAT